MTASDHAEHARAAERQQPAVVLAVAVTATAATACLVSAAWRDGAALTLPLLAFAALAALTDLREVRLPVVGIVTMSFVPVLAALIELGLWPALVVAAVSGAATAGFTRDPLKVTFNVANYVVSTFLAGLAYLALVPTSATFLEKVVPAFAATAVDFFANTWLLAVVVGLSAASRPFEVWRRNYEWALPGYLTGATFALVAAWLFDWLGVAGLVLALPPLVLIYWSYDVYVSRARDRVTFDGTVASLQRELTASEDLHGELRNAQLKVAAEIERAQRIQLDLLPSRTPRIAGLRAAQQIEFAGEVGGDYYDYISCPGGRLAIVCGDVMGKGLSAALIMAMTRSLLHDAAARHRAPGAMLAAVNDGLARDLQGQRLPIFVTLALAVFDPATRSLTVAGGGHNPAVLIDGLCMRQLPSQGPALGVRTGLTFREETIELDRSDRLALFTDGLTESRSPDGELFGLDRLAALLEETRELPIDDTLAAVWRAIAGFRDGGQAGDDATLLLLEGS